MFCVKIIYGVYKNYICKLFMIIIILLMYIFILMMWNIFNIQGSNKIIKTQKFNSINIKNNNNVKIIR